MPVHCELVISFPCYLIRVEANQFPCNYFPCSSKFSWLTEETFLPVLIVLFLCRCVITVGSPKPSTTLCNSRIRICRSIWKCTICRLMSKTDQFDLQVQYNRSTKEFADWKDREGVEHLPGVEHEPLLYPPLLPSASSLRPFHRLLPLASAFAPCLRSVPCRASARPAVLSHQRRLASPNPKP